MKKHFLAAILFPLLITTSCHKKEMKQTTEPTAAAKMDEVKVDAAADMMASGAAYRIDSVALKGDVLSVFVNYSGGCKEHSFELISNGMYAKSLPPKLTLCLKHTNNEDMCKKLVMQELKFNVSKIKYQGSKSLELNIGEKSANYSY